MRGRVICALVVIAAGIGVAGCGSAGAPDPPTRTLTALPVPIGAQLTRSAPASLQAHPLSAVGVTQHVETRGAALAVTLRAVIDPLRDSGAALQPGTRAVAVLVQIRNAGPAIYDSSATGDFTVVASSGAVLPMLARRGICKTPLNDFDRYITAGEDRVGCVVFAVEKAATVSAVRFSPHAEATGRLVWAA